MGKKIIILPALLSLCALFCQAQYPHGVVPDVQQLHHLSLCLFLLWVQFLVLGGQCGVLLLQGLNGRELLQAQAVKISLRRLAGNNLPGMFKTSLAFLAAISYTQSKSGILEPNLELIQ